MQLVTFGIDKDMNLIIQFPVFIQPYTQNSEIYISLRQQELKSCKRIGYEFCCEELFIVKHKSSYSCENAIYFNLTSNIIKNNCKFDFYFNKIDVTPAVLDGGDEILLTN